MGASSPGNGEKTENSAPRYRGLVWRWALCCALPAVLVTVLAAVLICASGRVWAVCPGAAAVLAAVLVPGLSFVKGLARRCRGLEAAARRAASGDLGLSAPDGGDDELGALAGGISEMSQAMSRSESVQAEFISSVSHELRTPLTAINGWAETLGADPAISGDSRRGIEIIAMEAGRLTRMVEGMLEFTRIQGGRFTLNMEKLDLASELEDAVMIYSAPLRADGVDIIYDPPEEELTVDGDPERLRQVFLNILDNAAKYGREGGRIIVTAGKKDGCAEVSVRDFGCGIPEMELPHVKELFYKGSSKQRGSGIGISVCDEIVSRHGGTLEIENAHGGGVLVTVSLPLMK